MIADAARRYWLDFRLPAAKLDLVRALLFGVIAVDAFLMLQHAPRYGAGGFNVSHLPWLDAWLPLPGRRVMVVLWLAEAYLAVRIVLGVAIGGSVRALTLLWGVTYFWSQLDSYQHHYLVFLILCIASFFPWERAHAVAWATNDDAGDDGWVASWAVRLLLVQLSIVYAWAAVAKLDHSWLDGTVLGAMLHPEGVAGAFDSLGAVVGGADGVALMAWTVLAAEIVLAVALLWRPAWPVAFAVGVPLHVGIELAGFEIGRFSYLLLALYALLLPDRWVLAASAWWRRHRPRRAEATGREPERAKGGIRLLVALALGVPVIAWLPFEATGTAALVIAVGGLAAALPRGSRDADDWRRLASAHLLACLALAGLHLATDQGFRYYNYLGGTSRRLGEPETASMAYRRLTEIEPGYGPAYYHLGTLAERDGEADRALALYRAAIEREPPDPRPYRAAADLLGRRGDSSGAAALLDACRRRVPGHSECGVATGPRSVPPR